MFVKIESYSHCSVIVLQVARVFYYLSAAALQYLAPTILLMFSVLMLRTLGGFTLHALQYQYSQLPLLRTPPGGHPRDRD